MIRPQYTTQARLDIEEITIHLIEASPQAARNFLKALKRTIDLLVEHPTIGSSYPHPKYPNLRAKLVIKFRNYVVFYTFQENNISIIRILHTARNLSHTLA